MHLPTFVGYDYLCKIVPCVLPALGRGVLGHGVMALWGKREAAPLRCAPVRVLGGAMLLPCLSTTTKQEERTMGYEFCKGWTDNQLSAAFSQAHMDAQSAKAKAREAAYWRDMAYIAMLTGGERPVHPGYRY